VTKASQCLALPNGCSSDADFLSWLEVTPSPSESDSRNDAIFPENSDFQKQIEKSSGSFNPRKVLAAPNVGRGLSVIAAAPLLTVVVPTFNEAANVPVLAARIGRALEGIAWELVFVDDDSPDQTAAIAKRLGRQNARIRCIRRVGRRGLSGACLEGALSSQAQFVAVMDGDLQHDETLLLPMLQVLVDDEADLIVGSRYADGGRSAGFSAIRRRISHVATACSHRLTGVSIKDPMSGFFLMRRDLFDELAPKLSSEGFKILFDILVSARGKLRIAELPYGFRRRLFGDSKLDLRNAVDFAGLLFAKATGNAVPLRFFSFMLVGLSGVAVQLACLWQGLMLGLSFSVAQAVATVLAMTSNFFLNNMLTYRDQRISGAHLMPALLSFYAVCSTGALSNVGVSSWLYASRPVWWLAGLAGSIVGAAWNYAGSSTFVWKRR
jgi:dolichol-phosphate mannosyltransferase